MRLPPPRFSSAAAPCPSSMALQLSPFSALSVRCLCFLLPLPNGWRRTTAELWCTSGMRSRGTRGHAGPWVRGCAAALSLLRPSHGKTRPPPLSPSWVRWPLPLLVTTAGQARFGCSRIRLGGKQKSSPGAVRACHVAALSVSGDGASDLPPRLPHLVDPHWSLPCPRRAAQHRRPSPWPESPHLASSRRLARSRAQQQRRRVRREVGRLPTHHKRHGIVTVKSARRELVGGHDDPRLRVTSCEIKVIPGNLGFVAQLNEGRHLKKRHTEFRVDCVLQPFDSAKFSFTKIGQEEVLFQLENGSGDDSYFLKSAPIYVADRAPNVVAVNLHPGPVPIYLISNMCILDANTCFGKYCTCMLEESERS